MGASMGQQDLLILPHHHQQWQQPLGQATTMKRERRNNRWVCVTCYRDVCGVCVVSAGGPAARQPCVSPRNAAFLFFEKQKERRGYKERVGGLAVYGTRYHEPLLSTLWHYTRYAGTPHIALQWHDAKRLGP